MPLPGADSPSRLPRILVHIHGGAWRDPRLTCASVEPTVARAFSGGVLPGAGPTPVTAIASLNYTASQINYPLPRLWRIPRSYDAIKDNYTDLAREAVHPQHVGMVSVNNSTSGAEARLPFGGNGQSGNGSRHSGIWVLDQFTRWQAMSCDYSGRLAEGPDGHRKPHRRPWLPPRALAHRL